MRARKTKFLSITITMLLSGAALASAPPSNSTMSNSSTMGNSSTMKPTYGRPSAHRGVSHTQRNPQGQTSAPANANRAMCSFTGLDKNGNGRISHKEAQTNTYLTRQFRKWDSNGDGEIERSEWNDRQMRYGSVGHPGRAVGSNPCSANESKNAQGQQIVGAAGTAGGNSTNGNASSVGKVSTMSNSSTMGGSSSMSNSGTQSAAGGGAAAAPPGKAVIYQGDLSGDNESPDVDSDAQGQVKAMLMGQHLEVSGYFVGLSSQLHQVEGTAAHVHTLANNNGSKNGPVEFKLNVHPNHYQRSGTFNGNFTLNQQQMKTLKNGDFYVNVHTTQHPKGELRAKLAKSGGFFGF